MAMDIVHQDSVSICDREAYNGSVLGVMGLVAGVRAQGHVCRPSMIDSKY